MSPINLTPDTWTLQPHTTSFYGTTGSQNGRIKNEGWNRLVAIDGNAVFFEDTYLQDSPSEWDFVSKIYADALWKYDVSTEVLTLMKRYNWNVDFGGTTELAANATDPTPVPRHPYSATWYDSVRNRFYKLNGANAGAPASDQPWDWDTQSLWYWDVTKAPGATDGWHHVPINTTELNDFTDMFEITGEFDPQAGTGGVFYWFGAKNGPAGSNQRRCTGRYQASNNTFLPVLDPASGDPEIDRLGIASCFDTLRRVMWTFGGDDGGTYTNQMHKLDTSTNTWSQVSYTGTISARKFAKMAYDSKRDKILIGGGEAQNGATLTDWYIFDPATLTITSYTPTGTPEGQNTGNQLAYLPDADCFLYYTAQASNNENVRFYVLRLSGGQTVLTPSRGSLVLTPGSVFLNRTMKAARSSIALVGKGVQADLALRPPRGSLVFTGKAVSTSSDQRIGVGRGDLVMAGKSLQVNQVLKVARGAMNVVGRAVSVVGLAVISAYRKLMGVGM